MLHDPVAERLQQVGIEFGHGLAIDLSRISAALEALGRPQDQLPPVLHVAGTNGKGSTCAFLRAILEASGLRVHVFTSPHLIYARERVRLSGALVDDAALLSAIDAVARCGVSVTYFETMTAAAMLLFAETPADYIVLEVGLGGLHDATNVIDKPAVSVITPVDVDHQHMLGNTLGAIAAQKAGILKRGCPGILGRQESEALAVITATGRAVGAPLDVFGETFDAFATPTGMAFQTGERFFDLPSPALLGAHQIDNAGVAIAAVLALKDDRITTDALATGLRRVTWPGRLQPLTKGELGARAQAVGASILVDGAHNPHGARALSQTLATINQRAPAPTTLVFGVFANKDLDGILAPLAKQANRLIAVPIAGSRASADPYLVAERARSLGLAATVAPTLDAALNAAFDAAQPGARIVICGSLHLAGEAIAMAGGIA